MSTADANAATGNQGGLTIVRPLAAGRASLKAALFDFDGTLSTLRQGWEGIMEQMMVEQIAGPAVPDAGLRETVRRYIEMSAGMQTIYQMQWLAQTVMKYGRNPEAHDAWWYKAEYNRRLMEPVNSRLDALRAGVKFADDYLVMGSQVFLQELYRRGIALYVASGTDHQDVVREAAALGMSHFFTAITGAPEGRAECSKETVLRQLMSEKGLRGQELLVIGDGKVEIALGVEVGAITLGAATDEVLRRGDNLRKRARLINAGAHAVCSDFLISEEILAWIGLS